jgi:hypothetical protein
VHFLGKWNAFARFLSMVQPLHIVLFRTGIRHYTAAMPRQLVWIVKQNFQGFGCSECNWVFQSSGALFGQSLDEMKQNYEAQRDKEFSAHVCAKHPKTHQAKA